MNPIKIIKLGGSVITDKNTPYSINTETIEQIAFVIKKMQQPIIIAHGSGSFGHTSAKKYGGAHGYTSTVGISKVFYDAMLINHVVMETFIKNDIPCVSLPPRCLFYTNAGQIERDMFAIIEGYVRQGLIPVVFGDIIYDTQWNTTIYSGEKTVSKLVHYLYERSYKIDRIIQLGNTKGYLKDSNVVKEITPSNWSAYKKDIYSTNATDVTGGMKHKIEEALSLAKIGIPTYLVDGNNISDIHDCLLKKINTGTKIVDTKAVYMEHEYVVLINEDNSIIGRSPKLEAHNAYTKRHRGFSVFLFNNKKQLLLQQRSKYKKTWPLIWSNSCCGHPKEGETSLQAARRRLSDELNLNNVALHMILPDFNYTCELNGIVENELCPVMVGVTTKTPVLNPDEVENVRWIDWDEWVDEIKAHPHDYSTWCVEETVLLLNNNKFNQFLNQ